MQKKRKVVLLSLLVALAIASSVVYLGRPPADEVMQDFFEAQGRGEDMLMDPLILHADVVAPLVIEKIKDKKMDKRLYAIAFLGNAKVKESRPVLRSILSDKTERDGFRGAALESIWQIDKDEGVKCAKEYSSENKSSLGRVANEMMAGSYRSVRRTYWQAWMGGHDCDK